MIRGLLVCLFCCAFTLLGYFGVVCYAVLAEVVLLPLGVCVFDLQFGCLCDCWVFLVVSGCLLLVWLFVSVWFCLLIGGLILCWLQKCGFMVALVFGVWWWLLLFCFCFGLAHCCGCGDLVWGVVLIVLVLFIL